MKKCDIPVWILTNQRSGSTFLSSLLNSTKSFPFLFNEHFHEHQIELGYYRNWLPCNAKILKNHYKNVSDSITKKSIKKLHPNIKFILLRRRDPVAHTISQYFHRYSKVSFIKKSQKKKIKKYENKVIPFNEQELIKTYKLTLNFWDNWNVFLKGEEHISIVYENFIKDPKSAIKRIFGYLDMKLPENWEPKSSIVKLENPLKEKYKKKLKEIIKANNIS